MSTSDDRAAPAPVPSPPSPQEPDPDADLPRSPSDVVDAVAEFVDQLIDDGAEPDEPND